MTHNFGWGGYMGSSVDQRPTYSNNRVVGLDMTRRKSDV